MPIALGENLYTHYRFAEFIDAGAVDLVQPNIVRVGGITPFRAMAALADDRGIDLAPHLLLELSAQLALPLPGHHLVESVEDASFAALGALAEASPVDVDRRPGAHDRPTGLGLRFNDERMPQHPPTHGGTMTTTHRDHRRRDPPDARRGRGRRTRRVRDHRRLDRRGTLRLARAVADALDAAADELVPLADEESHLGTAVSPANSRERPRSCGCSPGPSSRARTSRRRSTTPTRPTTPPRPDLRRMLRPLGPVAVFSASNFPFAFSVAGGDTASALAAGCPVIVKAHSAHPRLSQRTAEVVIRALADAGAPDGIFGHVSGRETGVALVQHPEIRAVGFTGSLHGGRALFDLASSRPDPIPFYGELSAVNPVLITAAALDARADELASGLAASFTLGAGQFCTNPGVVFVPAGSGFAERVAAAVGPTAPVPMLTDGIAAAFAYGLAGLAAHDGVAVVAGDPVQQPARGRRWCSARRPTRCSPTPRRCSRSASAPRP